MALITNPKIGYCSFPGISLLFDAPGAVHYQPHAGKLERLACRTNEIPFFAAAAETVAQVGDGVWEQHGLLPLAPESYHVTVWDGFNEGNADKIIPDHRHRARNLLHGMPFSIRSGIDMIADVAACDLAHWQGSISFVVDHLAIISDYVLVVLLKPANPASEQVLKSIEDQRDRLYSEYAAHYFLTGVPFMPHLSLGYFLRHEDGKVARNFLSGWDAVLRESLAAHGGPELTLESISLYGFTDMERFYRVANDPGPAPAENSDSTTD